MKMDIISSDDGLPFSQLPSLLDSEGLSPIRYIPMNIHADKTPILTPNYELTLMEMSTSNSLEDISSGSMSLGSGINSSFGVAGLTLHPGSPVDITSSVGGSSIIQPLSMPVRGVSAEISDLDEDWQFQRLDSMLLPEDCYGMYHVLLEINDRQSLFAETQVCNQQKIQCDGVSCLQDWSEQVNVCSTLAWETRPYTEIYQCPCQQGICQYQPKWSHSH